MATPTSNETFTFAGGRALIAMFFAIVPALTVVAIVISLFKYSLPYILVVVLLVLAGSCFVLLKEAISNLGTVTIELSPQELIVRRPIGSASYPWSDIDSIKLIDPGVTLSVASRSEENRAAIALFLRVPDRKETPPDDQPDVLVVTCAGDDVEQLTKAFNRIQAMKRGGGAARGARANGANGAPKSFRRPAAA